MASPENQLLLPVNPVFIGFSLLVAAALQMLPLGRHAAAPDLLALVLVFWIVHQPQRVGVGLGFVLGLLLDVHQGAVLGQHALAYTLMAYLAVSMHRRLLWFTLPGQALQVLPVFFTAHLVSLIARMIAGGMFPGGWLFAAPLAEAALWPLVGAVLLAPQRRAPNPDANRPL